MVRTPLVRYVSRVLHAGTQHRSRIFLPENSHSSSRQRWYLWDDVAEKLVCILGEVAYAWFIRSASTPNFKNWTLILTRSAMSLSGRGLQIFLVNWSLTKANDSSCS
jgi:hypothetical protein